MQPPLLLAQVAIGGAAGAGLPGSRAHVPQGDSVVQVARGQRLAVGAKGQAPGPAGRGGEAALGQAGCDVPQVESLPLCPSRLGIPQQADGGFAL